MLVNDPGDMRRRNVLIIVYPAFEELDAIGPWEVFGYLAAIRPDLCSVALVAEQSGQLRCAKGLRILPDTIFADAPPSDVLIVPGGRGSRTEVDNATVIDFIRARALTAEIVASVCTGTFLLERAGLRAGRAATTHWASIDRLRALGTVNVVADRRWVDAGPVVTAAGVSAGIDLSLYLVSRLWGRAVAAEVQKDIEYFPQPPVLSGELRRP